MLPAAERLLLGPGPSLISPRVTRLERVFQAPDGSFALAVSGTVVAGYFGDRIAQMCERYGADVRRLSVEWGRACDPESLRPTLAESAADLVTVVHAETSTGVLNPVKDLAAVQPEGARRAIGCGADCFHEERPREARQVPQLLLRHRAARGLLDPPQVSPHDVRLDDLRAA